MSNKDRLMGRFSGMKNSTPKVSKEEADKIVAQQELQSDVIDTKVETGSVPSKRDLLLSKNKGKSGPAVTAEIPSDIPIDEMQETARIIGIENVDNPDEYVFKGNPSAVKSFNDKVAEEIGNEEKPKAKPVPAQKVADPKPNRAEVELSKADSDLKAKEKELSDKEAKVAEREESVSLKEKAVILAEKNAKIEMDKAKEVLSEAEAVKATNEEKTKELLEIQASVSKREKAASENLADNSEEIDNLKKQLEDEKASALAATAKADKIKHLYDSALVENDSLRKEVEKLETSVKEALTSQAVSATPVSLNAFDVEPVFKNLVTLLVEEIKESNVSVMGLSKDDLLPIFEDLNSLIQNGLRKQGGFNAIVKTVEIKLLEESRKSVRLNGFDEQSMSLIWNYLQSAVETEV